MDVLSPTITTLNGKRKGKDKHAKSQTRKSVFLPWVTAPSCVSHPHNAILHFALPLCTELTRSFSKQTLRCLQWYQCYDLMFFALFEDNNNPATSKHVIFLLVRVTLQRKMHGANQSCFSHLLPSKSTTGCDLLLHPSAWPHDTKFRKYSFLKHNICFQISKWQYQLIRHNSLVLVVNIFIFVYVS